MSRKLMRRMTRNLGFCFRSAVWIARVSFIVMLAAMATAVAAQTVPSNFTYASRYDAARRVTGTIAPDTDGAGPLHYMAVRNTYDAAGRLIKIEKGELASWQTAAPATWSGFTVFQTIDASFDAMGLKVRESLTGGGIVQTVTEYSYDGQGRPVCTAIRMNPAAFPTPLADKCVPGPAGAAGDDRIEKTIYASTGEVAQIRRAVGTPLEQAYASYTYTANGKRKTVTDANSNLASMTYDGLDRQVAWNFPSTTYAATASTTDYEAYGYDANANRTSLRRRDGRTLTFAYDALNRVTSKAVPDGCAPIQLGGCTPTTATRDVYYSYDLQGRQTSARFDSAAGEGVINAYNGFGELASSTVTMGGFSRVLSYTYNVDGALVRLNHPDGQFVNYYRDGLDKIYYTDLNSANRLFYPPYDAQGRVGALYRWISGNWGTPTGYGYDGISRLTTLTHGFTNGTGTIGTTFGYNPASQIVSSVGNNDAYAFTGYVSVNRGYARNVLNQYTSAGAAVFGYDANGNLIGDGATTYIYDAENRLVQASNGATLTYDPLGRLWQTTGPSTGTTQFLYDGDQLTAEYDGAGTMLKRYVHADGDDDPLVQYDGPATTSPRFLYADHQGSIVALGDAAGNVTNINAYDEYGIPAASNTGRFQFTGQAWLPELGMFHYKARIYSPTLGRFLQTDPIGYDDQVNLYAYVGNDPVNRRDPSGLYNCAEQDCKMIEKYAQALRRAADTPKTGTLIADPALKAAANFVGTMNDGNKVDISLGKINGAADGNTGLSDGRASITLDPSKIGTDSRYGAVVLGHEAVHGAQFLAKGQPTSLADVDNRERAAYRVGSYISQRLGVESRVWFPGMTEVQRNAAVRAGARDSCVNVSIGTIPFYREPFPGQTCP